MRVLPVGKVFAAPRATSLDSSRDHGAPTSSKGGISYNYGSVPWTPYNINFLEKVYQQMPLSMQCNQSSGARFPVSSTTALSLVGMCTTCAEGLNALIM